MKLLLNNYLTLAFLVGYLGAVKFRCDYSFSRVGWFKYHKIPATWHDARLRCHYEGAVLASPVSTEIRTVMINAIGDVDIFTGINSNIGPGVYRSVEGIPLETIYHLWADNEPDNKHNAERCLSLNSEGNFSDVSCDEPRPYMCFRANSIKDATACGTPDQEYGFEKKTNKCYKFHTTPQTFERADLICDAEGGHLAVINSKVEFDIIRSIFAKKPADKIIGANRTDVAFVGFYNLYGEWTTIHGQSLKEAGFDKFFSGEPNNGTGEYCGSVFRNGYLNDLSCDKHFAFICEKQTGYPAVCDNDDFDLRSTYGPEVILRGN